MDVLFIIYIIYYYYFFYSYFFYYYFYPEQSKNMNKIIISSNMQLNEAIDYSIRHFIIFEMYNEEQQLKQ